MAHGLSCSAACGIFPGRGSNPCPVHWQADSQPLRHQGTTPPISFNHFHVSCAHSSPIASLLIPQPIRPDPASGPLHWPLLRRNLLPFTLSMSLFRRHLLREAFRATPPKTPAYTPHVSYFTALPYSSPSHLSLCKLLDVLLTCSVCRLLSSNKSEFHESG